MSGQAEAVSRSISPSRTTFRGACADVAWQKQLRDRYLSEGAPPGLDLTLKRAVVRPVSRKLAEQVILKYEWLGTMAATKQHFGIFFGSYCAGVCCVGGVECVAAPHLATTFRVQPSQVRVLARGACVHWAPPGTNSKLVSWTVRLLAQDPNAKVVIAYSDTDAGEIGTIYQACNWAYLGASAGGHCELVAPSGRVVNSIVVNKMASADGMTASEKILMLQREGWRRQKPNPKGRYVWILDRNDKALMDLVERKRLPYPKRACALGGPVVPTTGGGSTPTHTLDQTETP